MQQETKNIVILSVAIGAIYLLTKKPATKVNVTGFKINKEEKFINSLRGEIF